LKVGFHQVNIRSGTHFVTRSAGNKKRRLLEFGSWRQFTYSVR